MDLSDVTIDWLEERLEGWEGSDGQFAAWCPCHDDMGTSWKGLSISVVKKGKGETILAKCHSCAVQLPEIVSALEGDDAYASDVTVNIRSHRNGDSPDPPAEITGTAAEWWVEKTGVPWEVWEGLGCETEAKEIHFLFAGFDLYKYRGAGGKEFGWSIRGDNKPPLWPVPEDTLPEHIAVTEGESDCGTARMLGYHAFAITKGAGKGEKRYLGVHEFEALYQRGAREVTLFGDMDDSGKEMLDMTSKAAVDAGLAVNKVRLELILDPFSGMNDLNGIWKEVGEREECLELLTRATQRVSTRFKTLSIEAMMTMAQEEVDWLVPTLIAPMDKGLISGPQKSLKTYLALDLARSLCTCTPFMQRDEWTPKYPMRVHFVQEEGSPQLWARRIQRLALPEDAPFTAWHREGIRFTESGTIDELIQFCREEEVEVLFLDPMQRMTPGVDENDSSATGVVWDEVFRIQHACPGIVVIVIHHSNKTDRLTWESIRGSSRHAGEVDFGIFVQKEQGDFPPGHGELKIAVDGRDLTSDLSPGESFQGKYFISDDTFALDAQEVIQAKINPIKKMALQNVDAVLNAVGDGCRTREAIISQTGLGESSVRTHLKTLIEDGKVVEEDQGPGKAKLYSIKEEDDAPE